MAVSRLLRNKVIIILLVVVYFAAGFTYVAIESFKRNGYLVFVQINTDSGIIDKETQVVRVKFNNKLKELKNSEGGWLFSGLTQKILIQTDHEALGEIDNIHIEIGEEVFNLGKNELSALFTDKYDILNEGNKIVLEIPSTVRSEKSRLSNNFITKKIINWNGNSEYFKKLLMRLVGLLIPIVLILLIWILPPLKYIHLSFIFLITLLTVGFFAKYQVCTHHDGIMLKTAVDMADGKIIFRDFFSQYGILTTVFQAAALKIFGYKLIVIRYLTAVFHALIAVIMWLIFSRILPVRLSSIACLSWLLTAYFWVDHPLLLIYPWSTIFAVFSVLMTVYLMILYVEKNRAYFLLASGAAAACAFWFKLNFGIISLIIVIPAILFLYVPEGFRVTVRKLLLFISANISVHSFFLFWLIKHEALSDFFVQSINFSNSFMEKRIHTCLPLTIIKLLLQIDSKHVGASYLWSLLGMASLIVFIITMLRYMYSRKKEQGGIKIILIISFSAVCLWLSFFPVNALYHMSTGSVLFFGVLAYLIYEYSKSEVFVLLALLILQLPNFSYKFEEALKKIPKIISYEKIERPDFLYGMYVSSGDKQIFEQMTCLFHKYSNFNIINLTGNDLYTLFHANNKDFHKMNIGWDLYACYLYPDYVKKLRKNLNEYNHLVITKNDFIIDGYTPEAVFPKLNHDKKWNSITVVHVPGKEKKIFKIFPVQHNDGMLHINFKYSTNNPVKVRSIIFKVFSKDSMQISIKENNFTYSVLPGIENEYDAELIRKTYKIDNDDNSCYLLDEGFFEKHYLKILTALSNDLPMNNMLSHNFMVTTDTFQYSINEKIKIIYNGKLIKSTDLDDSLFIVNRGDNFVAEALYGIPSPSLIVVRINYDNNYYQQEKILIDNNYVMSVLK